MENLELLKRFDEQTLPNLDVVVLGALELFTEVTLSHFSCPFTRPLVVGSGGAAVTGKMLFSGQSALYATESTYAELLEHDSSVDGVVLISASGGKHAKNIAAHVEHVGKQLVLLTCTKDSPAAAHTSKDNVYILPKNREPYTYNTSTYLGMLLSRETTDPSTLKSFLKEQIGTVLLRDLSNYNSFTFIVPKEFQFITDMITIKFEELFEPLVWGRAYTEEAIKHAKTVIPSGDELFISLGVKNTHYGQPKHRIEIPLPDHRTYASLMAVTYYLIGRIQAAHPPYFKNNIANYVQTASEIFDEQISVIVE